jgi:hypothetical protein
VAARRQPTLPMTTRGAHQRRSDGAPGDAWTEEPTAALGLAANRRSSSGHEFTEGGNGAHMRKPSRRQRRRGSSASSSLWCIDRRTTMLAKARLVADSCTKRTRHKPRFALLFTLLTMLVVLVLLPNSWTSLPFARLLGQDNTGVVIDEDDGSFALVSTLRSIFKRTARVCPRTPSHYVDCTVAFLRNAPAVLGRSTSGTAGEACASLPSRDGFCVSWEVNMDPFWTAHWTTWKIGAQNRTHQCFDVIRDAHHLRILLSLARVQFPPGHKSVPESVMIKRHTGSGWGIDWAHVVDGLLYAVDHKTVPVVVISPEDWKYASSFDATFAEGEAQTSTTCTTRDIHCFVLPTHNLTIDAADLRNNEPIRFLHEWRGFASSPTALHVLEFATRSQTWIRREGAILASQAYPGMSLPPSPAAHSALCVAFHVRRGDVVLHGKHCRRYHAIAEYVRAYQHEQTNRRSFWNSASSLPNLDEILLMTDDANAVVEAETQYPNLRWRYVPRPRYRGSEGGWENPIPSGNSTQEVIVLQALEQLLRIQGRTCDVPVLVHSKSNLADYLYAHLLMANPNAIRIDLDQQNPRRVHSIENARSVELSQSEW